MITIYKYPLNGGKNIIKLPKNAIILKSAEDKDNSLCIWALVDTEQEDKERRYIYCFGTGWDITDFVLNNKNIDYLYLDSVITHNGLVWHLFELSKPLED